jgi:hypothetical protein
VVNGESQAGTTINISQGGVLLKTSPVPDFNDKVILKIELPGVKSISEIASIVRWRTDQELGLQFETLRPLEVWALNKLCRA